MSQKKIPLPLFLTLGILMFGSLACACFASGPSLSGFQATANAAFTQASSAAGTAGAVGNSFAGTAEAESTQAKATANAAGGNATAAPTTAGGATGGGPADIPLMPGDKSNLIAGAQFVTYVTKSALPAVATFYKDAMPKNGWTADATTTVETPAATILGYKKDTHVAIVTISKDPSSGQTLVAIALQ